MKLARIYVDTSVFGGCFDPEFAAPSIRLFNEFRAAKHVLLLSETTQKELEPAPPHGSQLLESIPREAIEILEASPEIYLLRDAYAAAGIVGARSMLDAEHIASATVADADLIVSWNFKHIVHFDRIRKYHGISTFEGYRAVPIHSPPEVVAP